MLGGGGEGQGQGGGGGGGGGGAGEWVGGERGEEEREGGPAGPPLWARRARHSGPVGPVTLGQSGPSFWAHPARHP